MKLFLLRHAKAVDTLPDENRTLAPFGISQIERLCKSIDKEHFYNTIQIWHSPYLRTKQTAEIFKREIGLESTTIEVPNITPYDTPFETARTIGALSSFGGDLLIVSHNPFLEGLANILLNANSDVPRITFRTSTLAALILQEEPNDDNPYGVWSADFIINPSILI